MAAVELLAIGVQLDEGVGDAVDVSAHARLVQTIDPSGSDLGSGTELDVRFETAKAATGPWREIGREVMGAEQPPSNVYAWGPRRVTIGDFDDFVRCRWQARRTGAGLVFGVSGTGV